MSYILDALKKAEAERNSESVPGIHTQPVFVATHAAPVSLRRMPWLWIGATVAALGLGALAWFKPWEPPRQSGAQPPASTQAVPPATAPLQTPEPSPAPPLAAAPVVPVTPAVPARPAAEAGETSEKPAKPAKPKAAPAREPDSGKAAAPAAARAKPPSKEPEAANDLPAPAEPKVVALHELPDNIRREIPPLSIGGYLYSGNKADRTVLINQKLLREGDRVAPDLLLERLTTSGLVLNYKGYRYRMPY